MWLRLIGCFLTRIIDRTNEKFSDAAKIFQLPEVAKESILAQKKLCNNYLEREGGVENYRGGHRGK